MIQYTRGNPNIRDFEFYEKNLFSAFFEMSGFGVELMTVSIVFIVNVVSKHVEIILIEKIKTNVVLINTNFFNSY